jgi:hypothetical protein
MDTCCLKPICKLFAPVCAGWIHHNFLWIAGPSTPALTKELMQQFGCFCLQKLHHELKTCGMIGDIQGLDLNQPAD